MVDFETINTTIPAGQTTSAPVAIGVKTIVGIVMPPTWAGGALTFRVSPDGGVSFQPYVDTSNDAITIRDAGGRPIHQRESDDVREDRNLTMM
jgi:hypothetical protein